MASVPAAPTDFERDGNTRRHTRTTLFAHRRPF
jgi:hypothetical protein